MMCRVEVLLRYETPRYVAQDAPRIDLDGQDGVYIVLTVVNVLGGQETALNKVIRTIEEELLR